MAPNSSKKSVTKENADLQKRIIASKKRVLKIKRDILAIVEAMLEENISKDWFLNNVVKLCHADYDDVIQERSIERLCGFPLCSNQIIVLKHCYLLNSTLHALMIKQKYHISQATNRVFDLTERKNFCGNICFKASQYLKNQLSPIPLYMRKEECIKVNLLSDCDNKGSIGEEIKFHHKVSNVEAEKVCHENIASCDFAALLKENVKSCSDLLSGLQITEHIFENQDTFKSHLPEEKELDSSGEIDSDDSIDDKLFPAYDNLSTLPETHMPVPKNIKSQLIQPKPAQKTGEMGTYPVQISLNLMLNVFKDWMTEDTMKYLFGEKYVHSLKADQLFEKMTASNPVFPDKLKAIKNEYINMSLKLDSLPDDDFSDATEIDCFNCTDVTSDCFELPHSTIQSTKTSFKQRTKNSSNKVTFATDIACKSDKISSVNMSQLNTPAHEKNEGSYNNLVENSVTGQYISALDSIDNDKSYSTSDIVSKNKLKTDSEKKQTKSSNARSEDKFDSSNETCKAPEPVKSPAYEGGMPFVDSLSQNALRKQILISQFKTGYNELLPIIGLHDADILESIKVFVGTLSLTPTNVIFKPKEWKVLCLILLRILTRTIHKDFQDEAKLSELCENPIIPIKTNLEEIDNVVCDILSPESILSLSAVR